MSLSVVKYSFSNITSLKPYRPLSDIANKRLSSLYSIRIPRRWLCGALNRNVLQENTCFSPKTIHALQTFLSSVMHGAELVVWSPTEIPVDFTKTLRSWISLKNFPPNPPNREYVSQNHAARQVCISGNDLLISLSFLTSKKRAKSRRETEKARDIDDA